MIRNLEPAHIYRFIGKSIQVTYRSLPSAAANLLIILFIPYFAGEKPFVCPVCSKRFRVRGDLKRHSNIHERNKAKEAKLNDLGALSNESNSTKTDLFTIDENNTSHSRSTDTLDQLVSVIESTETSYVVVNASEPLKKRVHSPIDYQKSPSKYRFKRDARASDNSTDCLAINYSTGGFIEKSS